jgi:hypothetical protein
LNQARNQEALTRFHACMVIDAKEFSMMF